MSQKNLNSKEINKFIGKKIVEARKNEGITQQSLANFLGISRIAMSSYETGRTRITIPNLALLSKALGKPIDFFIQDLFEKIKEKKKIKVKSYDISENVEFEVEMSLKNYLKHHKVNSTKSAEITQDILNNLKSKIRS